MIAGAGGRTSSQVLRFLLVGSVNTVLTGALFLALSSVTTPELAYTVAFVVGVVFAVMVTPRLVFRARASRSQRVRYAGWYLSVYVLGLGVVYVLHDRFSVGTAVIAVITFVLTAGLSFLGARFLFSGTAAAQPPTVAPVTGHGQ